MQKSAQAMRSKELIVVNFVKSMVYVCIQTSLIVIPYTAASTPQLKDLHNHITPHYAAHWRAIGTVLGLPSGTLEIIKYDNRDKAEPCCDAVLEEWLEVDPSASWNKLLSIIQSPAVSGDQTAKEGITIYSLIINS